MTADINTVLQKATEQRLWGQIQLEYQDGRIVLIRKTETFKPETSRETTHDRPRTIRY